MCIDPNLISVRDPFADAHNVKEERLRWILQDYYSKFPFDNSTAKTITKDIKAYSESLINQVGLVPSLKQEIQPTEEFEDIEEFEVVLDIVDAGQWSRLGCLHWETMQMTALVQTELPKMRLSIRHVVQSNSVPGVANQASHLEGLSRDTNILIVVSRYMKRDDIDPLLGSRAIYAAALHTTNTINIEILRPGTWASFQTLLKARTEQWWARGGVGPWFDVVHFDVHGVVIKDCAYLLFLTSSGQKFLKRSCEDAGRLLEAYMVRAVVLNACESAKATGVPSSNLARNLISYGIEVVIGMSFELTNDATEIFMRAFYFRNFSKKYLLNFVKALACAREALSSSPKRVGRLNVSVSLPDYLVPVMYVNSKIPAVSPVIEAVYLDSPILTAYDLAASSAAVEFGAQYHILEQPPDIIGREKDVLEVEWRVLQSNHPSALVLSGSPRVGKTAFVKFLGEWWSMTDLVGQVRHLPLERDDLGNIFGYMKRRIELLEQKPSSRSALMILDDANVSSYRNGTVESNISLTQRAELSAMFKKICEHKDVLLIVCRTPEDWYELPQSQHLKLPPLTAYHASKLAARVIEKVGWKHTLDTEINTDYVDFLNSRFNYNPMSILSMYRAAKTSYEQMKILPGFGTDPFMRVPNTPQNLFLTLLLAILTPDFDNPAIADLASGLIKTVGQGPPADCLSLFSLTIVTNICPELWFDIAAQCYADTAKRIGYTLQTPTETEIAGFVTTILLSSGWMEAFDVAMNDNTYKRYFRVHPILTNLLRYFMLSTPELKPWHEALTETF